MKTLLYAGSFDPLTLGHLDIIQRSVLLCDRLIIAVADNAEKSNKMFLSEMRVQMIKESVQDSLSNVSEKIEVCAFHGLLVDFAEKNHVTAVVRGLRNITDFEYEFQMASVNKNLLPQLETIFLCTDSQKHYISSRLVKELITYKADLTNYVPRAVFKIIKDNL